MQLILQGKYDAAIEQLEGARTGGASPSEVENLRGLALLLGGKAAEAIASFDRALALEPSLEAARFNRGMALLRQGDTTRASAEFQAVYAIENSPLRASAAFHNGLALERLGKPAEAEIWLDRVRALDEEMSAALLYLGFLRERRGDLQGAGRAYFDYLAAHPDSTVAMLRFGLVAHKAGRIEVAKTYLEKVVATAPSSREGLEAQKFLVMWE